jgi:hypothetical protein
MPRDGATASEEAVEIDASELVEAVSFFRHLKAFRAELAELAKMDSPTEQHRRAYAQNLAVELLQQDPKLSASGNLKPLFDIHMALHDDVETKPKITYTHYAQGAGVAAYAALVNPDTLKNPRQDGMKPAKARELLDEMLRKRNLDVSGITLQSWHYHVVAGTAAPAMIEAFRSWESVLAKLRNATEAKACAAEWLDVVASLQLPSLKLRDT